jgi:hypothetical protein
MCEPILEVTRDAQIGDHIIVRSKQVGVGERSGEIIEILTSPAGKHYRVRWDDDHETTFFPSSDATVEHT